jgi:CPA1 family monovalent cation:H+ antiporter
MDPEHAIGAGALTIFWMLVVVAGVALVTKRIRVPYTVALVVAGLGLALIPGMPHVDLTPDLILAVFLPTLIFEAAYNIQIGHLRENLRAITVLAIPGVLLTAGIVAAVIHYLTGIAWPVAVLFGAIVAATDPVAVVAAFKALGAPLRLRTIIEGESLFNDGTALVLFRLVLGLLLTPTLDLGAGLTQFAVVILGGGLLGLATGYLVAQILRRVNDYLVETVLTVILAYGTYFLAEELHVSGVIAVVVAGLLVGNYAQQVSFTPTSQIAVGLSWEFFGFLANSLIFLFVGLQIPASRLVDEAGLVAVAIGAVLIARFIAVRLVGGVLRVTRLDPPIPAAWQLVLIWGGLRGALSLAMVLSIPHGVPGVSDALREQLLVMSFGVILFTLLVQGLTIGPLLHRLGLIATQPALRDYTRLQARLRTIRAAQTALDQQVAQGLLAADLAAAVQARYAAREQAIHAELAACHVNRQELWAAQLQAAERHLLTVERNTLRALLAEGLLDEEGWRELAAEVDQQLTTPGPPAVPAGEEGGVPPRA